VWVEGAVSMDLGDTEADQHNAEGLPAFRLVRRGYDRDEVDAYFSQLAARLREAVDQYARVEQVRAELQAEVARLRDQSP
jgi:DivIVA domain-containing protein